MNNIENFLDRIYRIKQAMTMHYLIADEKRINKMSRFENFFGSLQSKILNRLVVIELLNIFNSTGNKVTLEKLITNLGNSPEKNNLIALLPQWRMEIEILKTARDKSLAHFDDWDIYEEQYVNPELQPDYGKFWPIVNELECLLKSLFPDKGHAVRNTFQEFADYDPCLKELQEIINLTKSS